MARSGSRRKKRSRPGSGTSLQPKLVFADEDGRIYDHPHLLMMVDGGDGPRAPRASELVPVPRGSDLYVLDGRLPAGFDPGAGRLGVLDAPARAVSAFLAPAWLRLAHPVYQTAAGAPVLPTFAYAPMGFYGGQFWTTAVRVDPEPRQDPWRFDCDEIAARVRARRERSPGNALIAQLERCALEYGCRAAQNYFLGRFEAPLPLSEGCNARCVGCISRDPVGTEPAHERILNAPSPEEIAEVACEHIARVDRAVVSFGQGCEGEPLLRWEVIEEAIRLIRGRTGAGTINLNTNASRPPAVERLCAAGLDSLRISTNSVVPQSHARYYRPRDFAFEDVAESARVARRHGIYVMLNLLVFPGLNDRPQEVLALEAFVEAHGVDMVQMRNLNIDPELYRQVMGDGRHGGGIGLVEVMRRLRKRGGRLRFGYFNPPRESFGLAP